jgi:hypothetical protein
VQIQLRHQLAHFLGAPRKQRQDPTLEPLLEPAQPRLSQFDRAGHHRQPPHLAILCLLKIPKAAKGLVILLGGP